MQSEALQVIPAAAVEVFPATALVAPKGTAVPERRSAVHGKAGNLARPRGFEPLTYGSGGGKGTLGAGSTGSQRVENVRGEGPEGVQPSHPEAALRSPFAAPVLQPGGDAAALLSVRDAAARLGVCTATIYTLCERGELAHVRVLNAIRIAASDVVAFVDRNTSVPREAVTTGCQAPDRARRSKLRST